MTLSQIKKERRRNIAKVAGHYLKLLIALSLASFLGFSIGSLGIEVYHRLAGGLYPALPGYMLSLGLPLLSVIVNHTHKRRERFDIAVHALKWLIAAAALTIVIMLTGAVVAYV